MATTKDSVKQKLLLALKRHNPHKVRAYQGDDDDTARDINVPQRRRRWATVIDAIEAKPWSRVEFLAKDGSILGYADNDEAATDPEDLGDGGRVLKTRSEAEWIVQLVLRTLREDRAARNDEVSTVLQAQGVFVKEMGGAVTALARIYEEQRDAAAEAAAHRVEAAADNGDFDVKGLLEAAPVLIQALPMIREMMNGKGKH